MKTINILILVCMLLAGALTSQADENPAGRSRRSSICSIMLKHKEQKFADEIERQFSRIPISPRFNDHNLAVRVINAEKPKVTAAEVDEFIRYNNIASRLVARWFDRNILTGECTMDTIKSRGLYDASAFEREVAERSVRGLALLEDAGEDLIGNTFLLINEVNYVDKNKRAAVWATIGSIAVGALFAIGGANSSDISKMMKNTATIIQSYKGFSVKIRTRLYRLVWDEETANKFYANCYTTTGDTAKMLAFEQMRPDFRVEYVGEVVSKGGKTSFLGINEEEPYMMVRKACARAIDENIADLQHKFEPFRIKTPITSVSPEIKAQIGKKEGVTPASKFEVLEVEESNGKIKYHRVGVVKPVAGKIWDNRFMATEEKATGADLGATSFVKVSGKDFYPGLLLREID